MDETKVTAIITAAGKGVRAGFKQNKLFAVMPDGNTVLKRTALAFDQCPLISHIIFTASKEDGDKISELAKSLKTPSVVVPGGSTRMQSVKNALEYVKDGMVLIHDGARPYVDGEIIKRCVESVKKYGTGVAVMPCTDTIGEIKGGEITGTKRKELCAIQTPQGFMTEKIREAFKKAKDGEDFTDDAGVYCRYAGNVRYVKGSEKNIKLTYPEDFGFLQKDLRVGTGFDLHRLVLGRPLILGGITVKHTKGLEGHSDADVLTHAICDALLSSVSLGDIGRHFSDKDPKYKDISSMILLDRVLEMLEKEGFRPKNVAAVIIAEKPKLAGYVPAITENLALALKLNPKDVGITCSTTEGVGITGREEAIAVNAYCSVVRTGI